MQRWNKLGLIFCPDGHLDWMMTHAANPFSVEIRPGIFRIFFTCRNANSNSHIGFVEVDFENSFQVLTLSETPVLSPGEPGMFDDSGVAMGYLTTVNGKHYLYYLGWNLKVTVPWLNTIGLAIFDEDQKKFIKYSRAPIMDRSNEDPFSISYPSILYDQQMYRMWYGSNLKWGHDQSEMNHVIKYAESLDGLQWHRTNQIHVGLSHPGEYALSKPIVIKDVDAYRMWYSYRASPWSAQYRIGYAESQNGFTWKRQDDTVSFGNSNQNWDSEMNCYPYIFDYKQNRYMLYNGNGYGKTGFGIALLEK